MACIIQTEKLHYLADLLNTMINPSLYFNEDGLSIDYLDPTNIFGYYIFMPNEAFNQYDPIGGPLDFDKKLFHRIVKQIEEPEITLTHMHGLFTLQTPSTRYSLPLWNVEEKDNGARAIIAKNMDANPEVFEIPKTELKKAIETAELYKTHLMLKCLDGKLFAMPFDKARDFLMELKSETTGQAFGSYNTTYLEDLIRHSTDKIKYILSKKTIDGNSLLIIQYEQKGIQFTALMAPNVQIDP